MAKTLAQLKDGEDMEGDESYCDTIYNIIKNHFREANPKVNVTNAVAGMIPSDSDDNNLWHVVGGVRLFNRILTGEIICAGNEVVCADNEVVFAPII